MTTRAVLASPKETRKRLIPRWIPILAGMIFLPCCGGVRYEHDGIYYSPFSEASKEASADAPHNRTTDGPSIRKAATMFARERLKSTEIVEDFGQTDIADLFTSLKSRVDWQKDAPLSTLIRAAERRKAFNAEAAPRLGDIVLFHNQTDRNNNRQADDWLTGCGIVISTNGDTFTALVRTGRSPRSVNVTPDTPSVRTQTGRVINSFLRVPTPDDPPDAEYLAGQLYAGRIDIERLLSKKPR